MTVRIPLYCTATFPEGRTCHAELADHVHQPKPCANGHDERHHAFVSPKSVTLEVGGQRRYVRLRATA